jgi:hypothetical protein
MSGSKKPAPKAPAKKSRAPKVSASEARGIPEAYKGPVTDGIESALKQTMREDLVELGLPLDRNYHEGEIAARAAHLRAERQLQKLDRVRELLLSLLGSDEVQTALIEHAHVEPNELWGMLTLTRDLSAPAWQPCPECKHLLLDHQTTGGCTVRGIQPCNCSRAGVQGMPFSPLAPERSWSPANLRKRKHKKALDEFRQRAAAGDADAKALVDQVDQKS